MILQEFVAGWVGGMMGLVFSHPFDTLKVNQQNYGIKLSTAFQRIYKDQGFKGFYKGLLCPLLAIGPSNGLFFGIYGNLMRNSEQENLHKSLNDDTTTLVTEIFLSGCIAGFIQAFVSCPVELVKTILQVQTRKSNLKYSHRYQCMHYSGVMDIVKKRIKQRGLTGLYCGFVPLLYRDVPTSGIYTVSYEMLLHITFSEWKVPIMVKEFIAGGSAGVLSSNIVLPIDVIKSRIQSDHPCSPQYHGMIHCAQKMYQEEGCKAFMKGFYLTFVRVFIMHAVTFVTYETMKSIYVK